MSIDETKLKMFLNFAQMFDVIPDENVGEGVKAALHYYQTGEMPDEDFDNLSSAVFYVLIECLPEVIKHGDR